MTNTNELNARLDQVDESIKAASNEIAECLTATYCTKDYAYSGFCVVDDFGCIEFSRNGGRYRATPTDGEAFFLELLGGENVARRSPCTYRTLPAAVREILRKMSNARARINALNAERDAIEAEIKAIEKFGADRVTVTEDGALLVRETMDDFAPAFKKIDELIAYFEAREARKAAAEDEELPPPPATITIEPVRKTVNLVIKKDAPMVECPLNETAVSYEWANAFRNTLAERVNARELLKDAEPVINPDGSATIINCADTVLDILGLEYTELSPCSDYTVRIENFAATMAAVDKDLIDDVKSAFDEIDGTGVNELLTFANSCEEYGRPATARAYREVAQLAACYSLRDAIEEQPELEDLLGTLFDWSNPVQLPPDVLAGIEDEYNTAREVLRTSLLSPSYLSLSGIDESIYDWSSLGEDYFCNAYDDDGVCAVSFHTQPSVYIEYFNGSWLFTAEGKTEVLNGYNAVTDEFQATINRFIELRGELC